MRRPSTFIQIHSTSSVRLGRAKRNQKQKNVLPGKVETRQLSVDDRLPSTGSRCLSKTGSNHHLTPIEETGAGPGYF